MLLCVYILALSGVTVSKLGEVRLKGFWAHAFSVNRDSSVISPVRQEISPFRFISTRLPLRVYNLPVFEKFSDAPLPKSSLEIFCNTPNKSSHKNCSIKSFLKKFAKFTATVSGSHVLELQFHHISVITENELDLPSKMLLKGYWCIWGTHRLKPPSFIFTSKLMINEPKGKCFSIAELHGNFLSYCQFKSYFLRSFY